MSQNLYSLSLDSIKYILGLIRDTVDLPTTILDDLNIATNTTYSSYRLDTLLKALKDENIKYCDEAIAGLNKLTKEIVDDSSKVVKENTIYLILTNPVNNVYEQWLLINGTPQMIGTTEMKLDTVYTKDEANARYTLITDFNSLKTKVDKKVDKTDIIDNLTSIDIDKPLSANQGKILKDEVDLKANDSDVVKKTDIVTTIDKTSTDDKTPSASAIYNKSKNKIADLPNGTDILAYADSISNETVADTVRIMNAPNSPYKAVGIGSDFHYTIYNIADDGYKRIVAYDIRKNDMYMIMKHSGTWGTWRKVCSTNIKDVPVTTITNNLASTKVSLSNSDSYATYYVKNGTCYVTIWSMTILAACSVETIFNNLPKSAVGATCPLCNGEESFAQVFISPNSKVIAFNASPTTINKNGYCSFSYPVAES